jgi:hypothetical protein
MKASELSVGTVFKPYADQSLEEFKKKHPQVQPAAQP